MKDFLKFTLATVTGIVLSSIILSILGVLIIAGIMSASSSETVVSKNSVMFLDLDGGLVERTQENNPLELLSQNNFTNYGLDDILSSIKKAKEHEEIKGIYIQATSLGAPYGSLEEIRNALLDFKESGKFIVAYGDSYTQRLYYLASVADKLMLNPQGMIEWNGLASQTIFFKELLQKVGIEMQVFKVGTYKSAVEPLISTEISPANREQITTFIQSTWGKILSDVSVSRNISVDSLNSTADRMLLFHPSEESIKAGLTDTLVYKEGARNYLKQLMNVKEDDDLNVLTLSDMINVKKNVPKDKSGNVIAVYYAFGEIDGSETEGIISKDVVKDLRKLREDENIKAVILRVNSPGGSAYGSEQIWHEITLMKEKKPVIVSMGDYAASGGYYISCAADCIVAQPTTLTGSIGIFGLVPNAKDLTDKVGLKFEVIKTNKFADMVPVTRALNDDERNLFQMYINNGYNLFVNRCADGRKMQVEDIEKIAQGRIWTGQKAKEIGLVDELGGLDKALSIAVEKAGIENYTVLSYPAKKDFFTSLLEKKSTGYIETKLRENFGEYYQGFSLIKNIENIDFIQARVPFDLNLR